jgi:hypothetical protein
MWPDEFNKNEFPSIKLMQAKYPMYDHFGLPVFPKSPDVTIEGVGPIPKAHYDKVLYVMNKFGAADVMRIMAHYLMHEDGDTLAVENAEFLTLAAHLMDKKTT